jgi:hypothetical protein
VGSGCSLGEQEVERGKWGCRLRHRWFGRRWHGIGRTGDWGGHGAFGGERPALVFAVFQIVQQRRARRGCGFGMRLVVAGGGKARAGVSALTGPAGGIMVGGWQAGERDIGVLVRVPCGVEQVGAGDLVHVAQDLAPAAQAGRKLAGERPYRRGGGPARAPARYRTDQGGGGAKRARGAPGGGAEDDVALRLGAPGPEFRLLPGFLGGFERRCLGRGGRGGGRRRSESGAQHFGFARRRFGYFARLDRFCLRVAVSPGTDRPGTPLLLVPPGNCCAASFRRSPLRRQGLAGLA